MKTDVMCLLMIQTLRKYFTMYSNKVQSENLRFQIRDLGKRNYFDHEGSSYGIAENTTSIMISNEKGILCILVLKHL